MGAEAVVVVLVPFPAQGHVTPMLHLARALAAHGVAPTVAVPDFIHRRIVGQDPDGGCGGGGGGGVALAPISSGIADEGGGDGGATPGFAAIADAMERHMPAQLERLLRSRDVACLVVDVLASWAVPVAARCGVPAAGFWPAMLASYRVVAAIPALIEKGLVSESGTPVERSDQSADEMIRDLKILPQRAELRADELPWLVGDSATRRSRFAFWLQALHRARSFRWVLVNSFPGEGGGGGGEDHRQSPRVLPVGPLLPPPPQRPCRRPSSMWAADSTCVGWLDAQRPASVVYVSFGSWVGPIAPEKIRELAMGLEATGRPFLWALSKDPSWRAGLPDGYAARVAAGRGKVVGWAPQEDVLTHRSVGCYLTHCGWNSTAEAIHHGVRLLCYPVSGDQFINCAYITGVWEVGLRLAAMTGDEVSRCIDRIMADDGKDGARLREKMTALREKAVAAGARSLAQRNLSSFVDEINGDHLPLLMQMYSVF